MDGMLSFGIAELDCGLFGNHLGAGAVHEAEASGCAHVDTAGTTLFLARIWARETGEGAHGALNEWSRRSIDAGP
jgi:hypothetical protein